METKAREYYLECSNVNNPDTFVGDVYLTVRSDTSIHVIEYSAYKKLEAENKKLRDTLRTIADFFCACSDSNEIIPQVVAREALGEVGE